MTLLETSNPPFPLPVREQLGEFPSTYELTDLGELGAGVPLLPVAVNAAGQVLVQPRPPERLAKAWPARGFVWEEGRLTELGGALGGVAPAGPSANGLFAGQRRSAAGVGQAWASHRPELGAEAWPESESAAVAVNAVGEVAGHVAFSSGGRVVRRVFIHDGGEPRLLAVRGGVNATAVGLNESGTVLVNCACGVFATQTIALLWWGEAVSRLRPPAGGSICGAALTPSGRVCGRLVTPEGNLRAFLHEGGRTYDLNLNPAYQSEALAANDARVVVGRGMDDSGHREAFRWTPFDGMRPLQHLVPRCAGWSLQKAVAVNAAGWIAGTGLLDGSPRGYLLRPVNA